MRYEFCFYTEEDFDALEALVLKAYDWEYPIWSLSRTEFTRGLHPAFTGVNRAWERTVGLYRENGKVVAGCINEGNADGDAFFLFDSKERAEDKELLGDMIGYAKTYLSSVAEDKVTRYVNLHIPDWNKELQKQALQRGFVKREWTEKVYILPFGEKEFEVRLPEGYHFADGNTTPDFYLSDTHMNSFNYSIKYVKGAEQAFHDVRQMKHYDNDLDLCILDKMNRPVGMAIIWYDEKMPYCELEPLGVAWWERRKGLATAILHEAANRVMKKYPRCKGMQGGEQVFYEKIGYEKKAEIATYCWSTEIYPSWDEKSSKIDYSKEV